MRVVLVIVGVLLLILLGGVVFLLVRSRPLPPLGVSSELVNLVSLIVTAGLFLIAVASVVVAIAAYQRAEESRTEQQQTLESARAALEATARETQTQRELLDKSIEALQSQLALAEQQRADEAARLARRARLSVAIGSVNAEQLRTGRPLRVRAPGGVVGFDWIMTNIGDAPLVDPVVIFQAEPETVVLYERGNRFPRPQLSRYQFSGPGVPTLLPSTPAQPRPTRFQLDVIIPPELSRFQMTMRVRGVNLDNDFTLTATIEVVG